MNDPRLAGRWWSTDPITKPWESPYAGYGNNPASFTDPLGLTPGEGEKDGKGRLPHEVKDLDPVVVTAERPAETHAPSNNQSSGPEKFVDIAGMTYQPPTSYDGHHITDYPGIFLWNTIKSFSNNVYGAIDGVVNLPHTVYNTIDAAGKVGAAANAAVHYALYNPGRAVKNFASASAAALTNPHVWENTAALAGIAAITGPRPSKAAATRVVIAEEAAPSLRMLSGNQRAVQTGGTPNSIYTYLGADGKAVSNYIYDAHGNVIYQVDFQYHAGFESGHGHAMRVPGSLQSGHTGTHIPFNQVPSEYQQLPSGVQPSIPIGKKK